MRDGKILFGDFCFLENKVNYCNFQGNTFSFEEKHIRINAIESVAKLGHWGLPHTGLIYALKLDSLQRFPWESPRGGCR